MPPTLKITKEKILEISLEIVSSGSIESLNVRNIATRLNCSVQSTYYQFFNMKELKIELIKYAYKEYEKFVLNLF